MSTQGSASRRVVVFGGTGRTGKQIVQQAVEAGHTVVCVGRSATEESVFPGSIPFAADVLDTEAVARALRDADVAIIALSIPRRTRSPFAAVTGSKTLHSVSIRGILKACAKEEVGQIIKLSAQGVGDSAPRAGIGFRLLVRFSNLRHAFWDHATADRILAASSLGWTIVRPPMLSDGESEWPIQAGEHLTTTTRTTVARADVARFVVACVADETWLRRCVTLAPARGLAP